MKVVAVAVGAVGATAVAIVAVVVVVVVDMAVAATAGKTNPSAFTAKELHGGVNFLRSSGQGQAPIYEWFAWCNSF